MQALSSNDFRLVLQDEFLRRCRRNPRYSVRAFARALGTDSSALSKILTGRRNLTASMHRHLGRGLGYSPVEVVRFGSYQERLARKRSLKKPTPIFRPMDQEVFEVIAGWYHHAILELAQTRAFRSDPKWIAQRLGISAGETHIAIERLIKVGLLRKKAGQLLVVHTHNSTVDKTFTTATAMRLQKQVLEMSAVALEEIPYEKRIHTSTTMAIDSQRMEEARLLIKRFRRQLNSLMSQGECDEVYQLGVSFFPLTQSRSRRNQ